jgi:hypothetical protein
VTCQCKGCDRAATHAVSFKIWGRGYPKTSTPLKMYAGLELCLVHALAITPSEFLSAPETRARIQNSLIGLGRVEADFDGAEAEVVPVEEARDFFRRATASR